MPDDQTLAMILTICDLVGREKKDIKTAVESYGRVMKEVIEYRRSVGETEVGGLPTIK